MSGDKSGVDSGKEEFLCQAAKAYDRMMKEDQEQMITFDQMEDRALEVGARLKIWLMERLLAETSKKKAFQEHPCCLRCKRPLEMSKTPKKRIMRGRTGKVSFARDEGYCPSCRKAFFPSGPDTEVGRRRLRAGFVEENR